MDIDQRPGWAPVRELDGEVLLVRHLASGRVYEYCPRCGGSGQYSFNMIDGTVCYGCFGKGHGKETTVEDAVRRGKNRIRARAKREVKAQAKAEEAAREAEAFRDAHSDLMFHLTTLAPHSGFLEELRDKAQFRPLTEKQVAAAEQAVRSVQERLLQTAKRRELGHLGVEGEKIEVQVVLLRAQYLPAERFDRSSSYLVLMRSTEGHILKTFSSGDFGRYADEALAAGVSHRAEPLTIVGTVKKHDTYNDEPQTLLTRVKIKEAP